MKNAIITTLSDSRWPDFSSRPEVDVFLKTAKNVPAELLIIADVLNRPLPFLKCPPSDFIIIDRWLYFYQVLCAREYDTVLLVDSRDVYFQGDPFLHATDRVLLSSEGVLHRNSSWNSEDQKMSQESLKLNIPFSDWPVVNGGVVLGPAKKVREYCLLLYLQALGSATRTDQAAINRLWNIYLKHDPDYALADPNGDTFCVTGETIKRDSMSRPTLFRHGKMCSPDRTPFALFHQWERTEYRDEILRTYDQR